MAKKYQLVEADSLVKPINPFFFRRRNKEIPGETIPYTALLIGFFRI